MVDLVNSFKKFALFMTSLIVLALATIYLFDLFVAAPINLPQFLRQTFKVIIILGFWLTIILLLRRARPLLAGRLGSQAAVIVQYLLGGIAVLVMSFGILHTLGVSPENLLTGAGIISLTVGLIISTFVGGILSGALVFTSHQFRVGDNVIVNNIPGRVTDMTALVTRIRTDVGQMSVPNSAIASGSVNVTIIRRYEEKQQGRLPYAAGDKVVTTYMNEEGTVKEITPLHTVILLDSGKELTFLNTSVLSGSIAVAKITKHRTQATEDP